MSGEKVKFEYDVKTKEGLLVKDGKKIKITPDCVKAEMENAPACSGCGGYGLELI